MRAMALFCACKVLGVRLISAVVKKERKKERNIFIGQKNTYSLHTINIQQYKI